MKLAFPKTLPLLVATLTVVATNIAIAASDNLDVLEQKAFKNAVEQVAPSVVRIETLARVGNDAMTRMTGGPTSGLIVDPSGLIVTSAAPFISAPGTILVQTPDGQRYAGKLVAVDHLRMLALLQVDAKRPLPVPQMVAYQTVRVGAWAIAVGRAYDPTKTNMAVGIVSGLDRIGNKAIQTDAATSPNNYGGPLIDIHGRVLGIIVPLSEKLGEKLDVSRYDSGIGFAIPIESIIKEVVPRLKKGSDLKPGVVGVNFGKADPNTAEPIVKAVAEDSPAAKANLQVGDRIVAVNSQPVQRVIEFRDALGTHYAGEVVTISFEHEGKRQDAKLTLAEFQPPKEKPSDHSSEN